MLDIICESGITLQLFNGIVAIVFPMLFDLKTQFGSSSFFFIAQNVCIVFEIHNHFRATVQIQSFSLIYSFGVRKPNTRIERPLCHISLTRYRRYVAVKHTKLKLYWQWRAQAHMLFDTHTHSIYYKSMPEHLLRSAMRKKEEKIGRMPINSSCNAQYSHKWSPL